MSESSPPLLSRRWKVILSVAILAHLTAVFAPPMAFQSRGPRGLSPSVATLLDPLASYGQMLYLDRGYAFFAPDPGPSHLITVEIDDPASTDADANRSPAEVRRFPSLNDQWPRLLYHRHFMLAEFLNDSYQPALPIEAASLVGPDLPAEELRQWRLGRKRYEAIVGSMTKHAVSRIAGGPGKVVKINRVEHLIPDFVGFTTRNVPLNEADSYITLEDFPITLETLLGSRPESLPQPGFTEPVPAPTGEPAKTGEPISNEKAANDSRDSKENLTNESETTEAKTESTVDGEAAP
ncbi:hypothetical protein [Neorhodopirellula pilleata]|uniref:hypothetical protein n=1 Tax=Neorhodopirellula pilleata TaxID=2714738 RepID=UPI001E412515|nr:hypothetical protein [Neorhodopirellula pilleata]